LQGVTSIVRATQADGASIAFSRQGRGDPVLLVPGGPGNGDSWAPVVPHLATRFTVVSMDCRARQQRRGGSEYSLELEGADVAAVAEALGGGVHVVGHSSGANLAAEAGTQRSMRSSGNAGTSPPWLMRSRRRPGRAWPCSAAPPAHYTHSARTARDHPTARAFRTSSVGGSATPALRAAGPPGRAAGGGRPETRAARIRGP
jgi:pimeloyl-ACP methyl ester carboxylesterase